jgi:hypothetical protein
MELAAEHIRLRDGEKIIKINVLSDDRKMRYEDTVTGTAVKNVFQVVIDGQVVDTCDSQAAARLRLKERLSRATRPATGSVRGIRVRPDGNESLVEGTVRQVSRNLKVSVKVRMTAPGDMKTGWVFWGIAPC